MFSDAKNVLFWWKIGESENKGFRKHAVITLKINYFGEQIGVSEKKGCPKTWGYYGM